MQNTEETGGDLGPAEPPDRGRNSDQSLQANMLEFGVSPSKLLVVEILGCWHLDVLLHNISGRAVPKCTLRGQGHTHMHSKQVQTIHTTTITQT